MQTFSELKKTQVWSNAEPPAFMNGESVPNSKKHTNTIGTTLATIDSIKYLNSLISAIISSFRTKKICA